MGFLDSLAGGVGGLVGGVTQAVTSYFNTKDTNKTNRQVAEQNLGFQRENLDYQKALQQEIFQREDTAHQREIEDLRAAGINPLATASGGNGANAGSVVPLTELNNNYQAQTTDFSGIGAAGAALDAAVQNQKNLEEAQQARQDANQNAMYERVQRHAEFTQEFQLREAEANANILKTMAEIAQHTEDNELKKQLEEAANKIAWANYAQAKREYDENASYRAEQERQLKIANERAEHDYKIDKQAGTKSGENQDGRITSAQRIIAMIPGRKDFKNENLEKSIMELSRDEALSLKILTQQVKSQLKPDELENPRTTTTKHIKRQWETIADNLKKAGRSQKLIDCVKLLQLYGAIPNFE